MVTLYHFMRIWGIPDGSPFCIKLEAYLRMAGIEYQNDTTFDIRKAPKGKFPLIRHNDKLLADTTIIIEYLKKEFGDPLDGHLNKQQEAEALSLQRLVEDNLYWVMFYFRWAPDDAWAQLKPQFFGHMPFPLKLFVPDLVRKESLRNMHGHGMSRHSDAEIAEMGRADLEAMSVLLGDRKYWFNDKPSTCDAMVFGFTVNLLYCPIPSPLKDQIHQYPNLIEHCERIKQEYFTDIA